MTKLINWTVGIYAVVAIAMFAFVAHECVPQIIATWNN